MSTVAVAIPTLAGGPMLEACLRALEFQTFRDFEAVVVNNGPLPISFAADRFGFPLKVLQAPGNVGFGAAVNLATRATDSRFVATLNDDTEPDAGWLEALVLEMEADPRVGMCASSIRLFATGRLDSAGMVICFDGSSKQRGGSLPLSSFPRSEDVLLPSACAALYRRVLLEEIGFFDEDFFLYCEDTDLGLRASWAGWRCRYAAGAGVLHHYSATAKAFSPMKAHFVERNRLWVAIKNFPLALLPAVPVVAAVRYLWQLHGTRTNRGAASQFIRSGGTLASAIMILVRAHWETLLQLPCLLRKRAGVRRLRKIGCAEFRGLLKRHRITPKELAHA